MANIWEKAISILVGNLNSGLSYLITTVKVDKKYPTIAVHTHNQIGGTNQLFRLGLI